MLRTRAVISSRDGTTIRARGRKGLPAGGGVDSLPTAVDPGGERATAWGWRRFNSTRLR